MYLIIKGVDCLRSSYHQCFFVVVKNLYSGCELFNKICYGSILGSFVDLFEYFYINYKKIFKFCKLYNYNSESLQRF